MSKEWHAAARDMLAKQCADIDILITTALIPGRPAPIMFTHEMIAAMKPGSVTVSARAPARPRARAPAQARARARRRQKADALCSPQGEGE